MSDAGVGGQKGERRCRQTIIDAAAVDASPSHGSFLRTPIASLPCLFYHRHGSPFPTGSVLWIPAMGFASAISTFWQLLTYGNPRLTKLRRSSRDSTDFKAVSKSGKSSLFKEVQFTEILNGDTCPPLSMQDLSFYCTHVEHSAENLEFYLAFLKYTKSWDALAERDKIASPEFVMSKVDKRAASRGTLHDRIPEPAVRKYPEVGNENGGLSSHSQTTKWIRMTSTASSMTLGSATVADNCNRSTKSSSGTIDALCSSNIPVLGDHTWTSAIDHASHEVLHEELRKLTGSSWEQSSHLPLRADLEHLIFTFLLPSSPQQVNIPQPMLVECLYNLQHSSNPAGLWPVVNHVYYLLTKCTMPNFIRYSSVNATRTRQVWSIVGAIFSILFVVVLTLVDILTGKPKIMRALGIPFFWFGCSALIASCEGFCFLLVLRRRIQVNPDHECFLAPESRTSSTTNRSWSGKARHHWKQMFCKARRATGTVRWIQNAMLLQALVKGFLITVVCSILVGFIPNYKVN